MNINKIIVVALAATIISCTNNVSTERADKASKPKDRAPNFVFIITDDMSPRMFNNLPQGKDAAGRPKNVTPHLDELIRTGSYLSELYVASPVCTPSRYNVLTGNYASRAQNPEFTNFTQKNSGQTVIQWNSFITPGVEQTIGSRLQALGYTTGFVGKNHVVESPAQLNQSQKPDLRADPRAPEVKARLEYQHEALRRDIQSVGFDFADNLYHNNPRWLGLDALAVQNMDWITEGGVRFLDEQKQGDKPFFLYFATTLPHWPTNPENSWLADPRVTPKGILDKAPKVQPARDTLTKRVEAAGKGGRGQENLLWLDDAIGALMDKLEDIGELDNTVLIFFNDHGQNAKGTLYEGGLHSQAFVWRKSGFKCGADCDFRATNIDFLETIVEMAGGDNFSDYSDGRSFAKALDGEPLDAEESQYFELGYARAVVKGNYKYLSLRYPEYAQNYTLAERKQLLEKFNAFRRSFGANIVNEDPSKPFGHLEMVPGGGGAENHVYRTKKGLFAPDQLYYLPNDPREENNLVNDPEHAQVLQELKAELKQYIERLPGKFDI